MNLFDSFIASSKYMILTTNLSGYPMFCIYKGVRIFYVHRKNLTEISDGHHHRGKTEKPKVFEIPLKIEVKFI